jgi:hypothetical protein
VPIVRRALRSAEVSIPWQAAAGDVHCATRRRKPGVCPNTLALLIDETDDTVLSIVAGEVLGTRFIAELLALVDRGEVDKSAQRVVEPTGYGARSTRC